MSWMKLPKKYTQDDSRFVILPISYEKDATYGTGAAKGAQEIIKASEHLEYYDEQFDFEPFLLGIKQLPTLNLSAQSPKDMVETVASVVKAHKNQFVIGLGGDHAVSIGLVKGMEQHHGDFSVLVLDAHSDFRDSWNNSSLNHACVNKQLSKKHPIGLIGLRSMDSDEFKDVFERDDVHVIKAYDFTPEAVDELLENLSGNVYISIDVDVFDPSFIRNTGTPEPGGLSWNQVIGILSAVFASKNVIGADIVEFAPKLGYEAESYALAKLAYKIMALQAKLDAMLDK